MSEPLVERPLMADYGVPTDREGALPWAWARERLVRSRNYWLATVDPSRRPHATPVWGLWRSEAGDDDFWFGCAPSAYKARNVATNPHVTVIADDTVEVVSVDGVAEVTDPSDTVIAAYVTKYWPDDDPAPHVEFMRSHPMFRVVPTRAYGIIEREVEFSQRATRWRWT